MSDDSDFDDIAHDKLLQSINASGSIKKNRLKKSAKSKIEASSLLSHITVSRTSTDKAKKSLGISSLESVETPKQDGDNPEEKKVESKRKKKIIKSKTLIPLKDVEARKQLEGDIAFKDLKKEVSNNWSELIHSNRIADQLIFPLTQPEGLLWSDEKEEEKLTEKEQAIKNATDIKMAKERLNQMKRMRSIIGIQEAKNRYMNKIKSKGYHRILKREKRKQLLKEFDDLVTRDPSAAHEKLAELDLQRIMERGSLKHRGQNQKFKQMLEKHASRNPEVKKLLDEHLRMGRELKSKIAVNDEEGEEEGDKEAASLKKKSIHDVLQDAATEAAKEDVGKTLVDSFLADSAAQKITLANLRAQKRKEAAALARNMSADKVADPIFEVDENWETSQKKSKKAKVDNTKRRKGTIAKKSYVSDNYDPHKEISYEEKVEKAVEEAGVNDEEKRRKEIEIDPRKFLELNTNDLTQVSSDFVEKLDQFDEETSNVINEAFKDDDVVDDFEIIKEGVKEKERVKDIDLNLAGWGDWVGPGINERKRRKNFIIKAKEKKRRDGERNGLIIKESVESVGIAKVQPNTLPFPYTRVEDYEAVLKQPLGLDWNTTQMRDELCKPGVVVEAGRAIRPINKKEILGEK